MQIFIYIKVGIIFIQKFISSNGEGEG